MPPTCHPHPAPTRSPPRACGVRLGLCAADRRVQDTPRSGELPLLPKLARPVCGNPLWAHEDSSTRAASPVCCSGWGLGPGLVGGRGSTPAGTPAQTCLPHHGRRFCLQHGPLLSLATTIRFGSTRPHIHRGHAGPVLEGLSHLHHASAHLRQAAGPAAADERTPGEGARRPGPSAALALCWDSLTRRPPSHSSARRVQADLCPDTGRPSGLRLGHQHCCVFF